MTTQTEALKLALEALERIDEAMPFPVAKLAQKAIKEALAQPEQELDYKAIGQQAYESGYSTGYMDCAVKMKAQPEQEPVAWANEIIDDLHALHDSEMIREMDSGDALIRLDAAIAAVEEAEQRYTTPPQRTWVGLTDEEIKKMRHLIDWTAGWSYNTFARAIEAKLKEKNT